VWGLPLIVVMPNGGRGYYTNGKSPGTYKYEDHIVKDVMGQVERLFPTINRRSGRVVGGNSMGGYGAVKLALKFPDLFCAANSLSGALTGPGRGKSPKPGQPGPLPAEFVAMFGAHPEGGPEDPLALAGKCPRAKRPALRIDCGNEDFLLSANRQFHALLEKLKYPHQYEEHPGVHDWDYWDQQIQSALAFHRRHLKI
jgi:S-formylglutathione hydrolase FrmB